MYFHIRHILKQFHKFQIAKVFSPLSEKKKRAKKQNKKTMFVLLKRGLFSP